jgi:hypothetical protein
MTAAVSGHALSLELLQKTEAEAAKSVAAAEAQRVAHAAELAASEVSVGVVRCS